MRHRNNVEAEHACATIIQVRWRAHSKRRKTLEITDRNVTILQAVVRRNSAMERVAKLRKQTAIVESKKISTIEKHACAAIQRWWRGVLASRSEDQILHAAATAIQACFRGFRDFAQYVIINYFIMLIQAHVRGHQIRKRLKRVMLMKLRRHPEEMKTNPAGSVLRSDSRVSARNIFAGDLNEADVRRDENPKPSNTASKTLVRSPSGQEKRSLTLKELLGLHRKEKEAALIIERFFVFVKAEVDKEIRQIEQKRAKKTNRKADGKKSQRDRTLNIEPIDTSRLGVVGLGFTGNETAVAANTKQPSAFHFKGSCGTPLIACPNKNPTRSLPAATPNKGSRRNDNFLRSATPISGQGFHPPSSLPNDYVPRRAVSPTTIGRDSGFPSSHHGTNNFVNQYQSIHATLSRATGRYIPHNSCNPVAPSGKMMQQGQTAGLLPANNNAVNAVYGQVQAHHPSNVLHAPLPVRCGNPHQSIYLPSHGNSDQYGGPASNHQHLTRFPPYEHPQKHTDGIHNLSLNSSSSDSLHSVLPSATSNQHHPTPVHPNTRIAHNLNLNLSSSDSHHCFMTLAASNQQQQRFSPYDHFPSNSAHNLPLNSASSDSHHSAVAPPPQSAVSNHLMEYRKYHSQSQMQISSSASNPNHPFMVPRHGNYVENRRYLSHIPNHTPQYIVPSKTPNYSRF